MPTPFLLPSAVLAAAALLAAPEVAETIAAPPRADCRAVTLPAEALQLRRRGGEPLFGVREIPGIVVAGRYTESGAAHPVLELHPDGTGVLEMHGAADGLQRYPLRWWVQASCDGTPAAREYASATAYQLVVEYDRAYQGSRWDRLQLAVEKDPGTRMVVLGRSKPKR